MVARCCSHLQDLILRIRQDWHCSRAYTASWRSCTRFCKLAQIYKSWKQLHYNCFCHYPDVCLSMHLSFYLCTNWKVVLKLLYAILSNDLIWMLLIQIILNCRETKKNVLDILRHLFACVHVSPDNDNPVQGQGYEQYILCWQMYVNE